MSIENEVNKRLAEVINSVEQNLGVENTVTEELIEEHSLSMAYEEATVSSLSCAVNGVYIPHRSFLFDEGKLVFDPNMEGILVYVGNEPLDIEFPEETEKYESPRTEGSWRYDFIAGGRRGYAVTYRRGTVYITVVDTLNGKLPEGYHATVIYSQDIYDISLPRTEKYIFVPVMFCTVHAAGLGVYKQLFECAELDHLVIPGEFFSETSVNNFEEFVTTAFCYSHRDHSGNGFTFDSSQIPTKAEVIAASLALPDKAITDGAVEIFNNILLAGYPGAYPTEHRQNVRKAYEDAVPGLFALLCSVMQVRGYLEYDFADMSSNNMSLQVADIAWLAKDN